MKNLSFFLVCLVLVMLTASTLPAQKKQQQQNGAQAQKDAQLTKKQLYEQEYNKMLALLQNINKGDKEALQAYKLNADIDHKKRPLTNPEIPLGIGLTTDIIAKVMKEKNLNLLEKLIDRSQALYSVINEDIIVIGHLDSLYHDLSFQDLHTASFAITVREVLKGNIPHNHITARDLRIIVRYDWKGKKYITTARSSLPSLMPTEKQDHIFFLSKEKYNEIVAKATSEGEKVHLWGFNTIFRTTSELEKKRATCYEYRFFIDTQPLGNDSTIVERFKATQFFNQADITLESLEVERQFFLRETRLLCKELKEYFPLIEQQKILLKR